MGGLSSGHSGGLSGARAFVIHHGDFPFGLVQRWGPETRPNLSGEMSGMGLQEFQILILQVQIVREFFQHQNQRLAINDHRLGVHVIMKMDLNIIRAAEPHDFEDVQKLCIDNLHWTVLS
jgi:hypothetical protein